MERIDYQRMFGQAAAELEKLQAAKHNLENQLSEVNAQIDAMTKTYNAIAPLVGEQVIPTIADIAVSAGIEVLKAAGISVAVRSLLDMHVSEDFTAAMVRDRLATKGWDWEKYVNPLSTVHTVLVRLAESGAAMEATTKDGKKCFYSARRTSPKPEPIKPVSSGFRRRYGQ
jgi:hypothetical protein